VEELAAILDGLPWILGGGLAIPFTLGEFHREHFDIDLLFDDRDFPAIEAAFAKRGYGLWQHYTMSLFGAFTGAWHVRVRQDGILPRIGRRRLKFRDDRPHQQDSRALEVLDALPFRVVDGVLCTSDGKHRYPLTRSMVGHRARSAAGHEIPCLAFEYVALLKGPRREPRDLHDFAVIRDFGRLPEGEWGL
jgi:hypothetical protein